MFNFQGISQEIGHKMLCCAFQSKDAFDETFISHLLVFLYGNYPKLVPVFSLSKYFQVKKQFRAPEVDTVFKFQPHSNSNIKLEFMFFCKAHGDVEEARDNLLRQIHYHVKTNAFQFGMNALQDENDLMNTIRPTYYCGNANNNNNNNVLQNNGNNNKNNNFAQYGNNNNNNNNFAQGNNNNYNNCGNNNNNNLQYGNNNNNNMIQYGNNNNNNMIQYGNSNNNNMIQYGNNNNTNMIESNNNNNMIQFNNNNSVNCLDNYGNNNNIVKHENDNNDILLENQNTISYFISEPLPNKDDVILVIKSVKAKLIQCYENEIVPDVESIEHEFGDATQKYKGYDPLWKVFVYHTHQVSNAIKIKDYQIGRAAVHAFIDDLHNCTQQTNH